MLDCNKWQLYSYAKKRIAEYMMNENTAGNGGVFSHLKWIFGFAFGVIFKGGVAYVI